MNNDRNIYTWFLSLVGVLTMGFAGYHAPSLRLEIFIVIALCIITDAWPLLLPDGATWCGGIVGIIYLLWKYDFAVAELALIPTTAAYFAIAIKLNRKVSAFRFLTTLGMYSISLTLGAVVIHIPYLPHILSAVLAFITFETINVFLLYSVQRSAGEKIRLTFNLNLLYPIFMGSLVLTRFIEPNTSRLEDLIWSVLLITLFFFMSRRYAQAVISQRDSESRYRLIAKHSSDYIAVINSNWVLTYVSPSHERVTPNTLWVTGASVPDILSKNYPEDICQSYESQLHMAFLTAEEQRLEIHSFEDTSIWDCVLSPIVEGNKVTQVIVQSRDITKMKHAEQIIRKSEKLAVIGQLAAGVAHEIRNPLTVLKGFLQYFRPHFHSHEDKYDLMRTELNRIEEIISEFLLMAKPDADSRKKLCDIRHITQDVVQIISGQANLYSIEFKFDFAENVPHISAIENHIKQVLLNILKNAIEAMPSGGTLSIQIDQRAHYVCISIQDTGYGIPEEFLNRLGEPFYTTKEKGTGLGLMVCYKIIQAHGGNLDIDSAPGLGTNVLISLPIPPNKILNDCINQQPESQSVALL